MTEIEHNGAQSSIAPAAALPRMMLLLLFCVSAAQNTTTSLLTMYFARVALLEPQQTAYYWLFQSWIYWFSPVSGWASDTVGNRKVLLLVALLVNVAAWCLLTWVAESFTAMVAFGALQNAAMMFASSALNGAIVEMTRVPSTSARLPPSPAAETEAPLLLRADRESPRAGEDDVLNMRPADRPPVPGMDALSQCGDTQSRAMTARSCGSLFGAIVQTLLLVKIDIRTAMGVSIGLYGIASIVACVTRLASACSDVAGPATDSIASRIISLFVKLRELCDRGNGKARRAAVRDVVLLLLFICFVNALPDATSFYQNYVFDAFHYPNWFYSVFQLCYLVGALVACEVYRRVLAKRSQTAVFVAGCLCAAFSYVTGLIFCTGFTQDTLHIPNTWYLLVDTTIVGFLSRIAFLPVLHVAASRCPAGFEAVTFELFSLAAMGGASISQLSTVKIADALRISRTHWNELWVLMLVSAAVRVVPLLVVRQLPPPVAPVRDSAQPMPVIFEVVDPTDAERTSVA